MAPTALLSVSNKKGLIPLAKALYTTYGYQLLSSGGTAKVLEEASIPVTRVADHTGAPEILGGRVKTLHPKIHGGILAKREVKEHKEDLKKHNISFVDLVVVNLYPFKETISKPNVTWEEAIENIDIGGPAMIRAAAKNHKDVTVLTNPEQYDLFIKALEDAEGITNQIRQKLAIEAFEHTAAYDITISKWMSNQTSNKPSIWLEASPIKQQLRYGENPHQNASWFSSNEKGWGVCKKLQGKELSTNNLLDLEAALLTVKEFGYREKQTSTGDHQPAAVVVKHTNPCGVAVSNNIENALNKALDADRVSAFGGIVALNSPLNKSAAEQLTTLFLECVVAPSFNDDALDILSKKKNLRLLALPPEAIEKQSTDHVRSIQGGFLIQDQDDLKIEPSSWEKVTKLTPSDQEMEDLKFAWKLVRHVRSNAILVASNGQSLGIGAGQMNRIGAARLALEAAKKKSVEMVLASDGFFPFDDTVKLAAKYGVKAIIQPGGSIKDIDSINACNELNISMIFTGKRHFLH